MKFWNKLLSLLLALVLLTGLVILSAPGQTALAEGDLAEEIATVGLSAALPVEGPAEAGAPAAVSIASGEGFTVQSACWYDSSDATPESFAAGQQYYAVIILSPEEGRFFSEAAELSLDPMGVLSKVLQEDGSLKITSNPVTVAPSVTFYPIWLGNIQVSSLNRGDILGDGKASYDPETNTLTLDEPAFTGLHDPSGAVIRVLESDLTVTGKAALDVEEAKLGIYVETGGSLTLKDAELTVKAEEQGILLDKGDLTVNDSKLKAESEKNSAIALGGKLLVIGDKSKVSGKSTAGGCGVRVGDSITVNAGSLEGQGLDSGIQAGGGISLAETHGVVIPEGGSLSDDGKTVWDSEGAVASHALLAPKDASFTVSFDTYGGPEVESQSVPSGGTAARPEDPSLTGFLFRGWYLDPATDEEPYDFSAPVTEDLELKAFWAASIQASVKDTEGNEGVGGGVSLGDETYETAVSANVWRDSPSLFSVSCRSDECYVFDHWEDGSGNPLTETSASFLFSGKDGSRHFVAVFRRTGCIVTFDTGEGGSEVPSQLVPSGGKASEPDEDPVRKGYVFDCWCSDKEGKNVFDFNTAVTSDITLYAKWNVKAKYTVVSGGGTIYGRASGKEVQLVVKRNPKGAECYKHFTGVKIDGGELKKDTDYTIEADETGAAIINLKPGYLGKLNTGRHIITIVFDDGEATTGLTVKAGKSGGRGAKGEDSPDTGDPGSPLLWGALLASSCIGLGGILLSGRRARRTGR